MTPPRRFSGLTTVPDAGLAGRGLTRRPWLLLEQNLIRSTSQRFGN
jgi:hypothetical protein